MNPGATTRPVASIGALRPWRRPSSQPRCSPPFSCCATTGRRPDPQTDRRDGNRITARRADVGIAGERITFIGRDALQRAGEAHIDATALVVAPGFIDPHSHTLQISTAPSDTQRAVSHAGLTTVITNNDGGGTTEIGKTLTAG